MKSENYFFLIFLSTIMIVRLFLFLHPTPGPTIAGFRFHHWMFGLLIMCIAISINRIALYAIGAGLFADELTYVLINGKTHADNYSLISLIGTVIIVGIIFAARSYFLHSFFSLHQKLFLK